MCEVQIYLVIIVLFFIKNVKKKKKNESLPTLPILFKHTQFLFGLSMIRS